jgi:hypothetical protein
MFFMMTFLIKRRKVHKHTFIENWLFCKRILIDIFYDWFYMDKLEVASSENTKFIFEAKD